MEKTPPADPAQAVQDKQQQDAKALFERLQQIEVMDLTVHYTLENSSVTLPAVLIRLLTLAVLFRLNSAHKWHAVFRQKLLPEPLQTWLEIEDLAELAERATVDWIPAEVLLDTLAWQVARCLTQCALPQPMAVIRQTIRDLLLREAVVSEGGLVLNRSFWRRLAKKGCRALSAGLLAECRQRIEFVLGQVDLAQATEGRWLEIPELEPEQRAKLEAVQVAEPTERLQALQEAFAQGQFDFVAQLLACSYSRYGRRAHHPLLMIKVWLAMLAVGCLHAARFLRAVDDSLQLRLFLEVMSHEQLPSERRIKGFDGTTVTGDGIHRLVASVLVAGRTGHRDRFGLWYGRRRHACASADEIGCGGEASDAVAGLADRGVPELLPGHRTRRSERGRPGAVAAGV